MKKTKNITITIDIYKNYENMPEFSNSAKLLIGKAKESILNAYAPYSNFRVAAAVLLENNEIIVGTNQENAAYPSGLCAERVALFFANSKYPETKVLAIAIVAFTNNSFVKVPVPPCGACRQVILEAENRFNSPIEIVLAGEYDAYVIHDAKSLLPVDFNFSFLNKY